MEHPDGADVTCCNRPAV